MICLNKADQGTFRHLTYNQSPPALAARSTTRQDLNGISNLREYVAAGQGEDAGGGTGAMLCETALDEKLKREVQPEHAGVLAPNAGRWLSAESSLRAEAVTGGDDQFRQDQVPFQRCLGHLWSWTTWILSVLLCSYIISTIRTSNYWAGIVNHEVATGIKKPSMLSDSASPVTTDVNVHKRSSCATTGVDKAEYNTGLHAAALFIIWFVSTMGCAFPIMAAKVPGLRIPRRFFFVVRHFGTGVLIATAFVHLLPTAFTSLGNPCLGSFWTDDYQAMPGAIALAAIFLVTVIEMVFHPSRHVPPADIVTKPRATEPAAETCVTDAEGHPIRDMGPLRGRSSSMAQGLSQLNQAAVLDEIQGIQIDESAVSKERECDIDDSGVSMDQGGLSLEQKRRKERLQVILLEMGILFHSVFIGMALSVSIGSDFVVLLIAIVFHQTFEGLALGSRISVIEWGSKTWQPWLMALAYGCTTPIGQAIGLATHTLYSPDSEIGLILVGVMNAISAGLLTFASLVDLLSEDFLSDESWRYLRGKRRVVACFLVFFGAFCMSLVGAWA